MEPSTAFEDIMSKTVQLLLPAVKNHDIILLPVTLRLNADQFSKPFQHYTHTQLCITSFR